MGTLHCINKVDPLFTLATLRTEGSGHYKILNIILNILERDLNKSQVAVVERGPLREVWL